MNPWLIFALGLAGGGLGALLGVGGGLIIVPGFVLLAGVPLRGAVAMSLLCVCANSAAASVVYLRRGRVALPVAIELQFFTVCGAVAAGLLAGWVPVKPLYFAFGALLAWTAWKMWPRTGGTPATARQGSHGLAAGASVGAGLLSGLLGVGGGIVNTPVLHLILGVPFERAVATSSYMIGITAAAGAAVYLARGDVNAGVAAAAVLGSLVGATTAAMAAHTINTRVLKMGFVGLLLFVAYEMVRRGLAAA